MLLGGEWPQTRPSMHSSRHRPALSLFSLLSYHLNLKRQSQAKRGGKPSEQTAPRLCPVSLPRPPTPPHMTTFSPAWLEPLFGRAGGLIQHWVQGVKKYHSVGAKLTETLSHSSGSKSQGQGLVVSVDVKRVHPASLLSLGV